MATIKRTRGDHWRIRHRLRYVDEHGEPLAIQPDMNLATSTFKATLRDSAGVQIWQGVSAPEVQLVDAPNRIVQILIPPATTATLPPGSTVATYAIDLQVTQPDGLVSTPVKLWIIAEPDLTP